MNKTGRTGQYALSSLSGYYKTTLLAGIVLFSGVAPLCAQTLMPDTIANAITQADGDAAATVDNPVYDASGRLLAEPILPPPISSDAVAVTDTNIMQRVPADAGRITREPRENLAESPVEGRGIRPYDADPYAPQGIRTGSFMLRPSLDQGIRSTSNADNSSTGSSAVISETTLRLNARSDWARHLATLDLSGTYGKNLSGQYVSEPRGQIDGALRLDLSDETRLNLGLSYSTNPENASDPNGISTARTRPLVQNLSAQAGLERDIGKIFARAVARVNNSRYGSARLVNGTRIDQSERNNTYVSMTLRGGYEISAAIRPFAEVELGRRIYQIDTGIDRNANQLSLRTGLQINRGEKLNGEFAIGYGTSRSGDPRLRNLSGLSVDAAMNWSPQRGTDVNFGLRTFLENSPDIGGNSSILYLANLNISRMIRSDLSLDARFDASIRNNRDDSGTDYGMGAEIGATYWFNRFLGLNTSLRHEFINSDVASRKYSSNSVYVGVKMQR